MAITDAKKVDLLWKKIGFGKTKTDTNAAKKAADVRRDLVAEQVAISCNTALVTDSDLTSADLSPGMTGSVKVKGSCGSKGSVDLIWKSGQERTISYSRKAERYIVK